MKLIDILVQELPKRGGWPEGVYSISQFPSGEPCYHDEENNCSNANTSIYLTKHEDGDDTDWAYGVYITREQYEAALAAKNEGWIDWGGGECPVDGDAIVDVKLKSGVQITDGETSAAAYYWDHMNQRGDIIAYRLHKPQDATTHANDYMLPQDFGPVADEADLNDCIGQTPVPVWNGEGLPPVGCECEFISNDTSWGSVVVIGMDGDKVVIKPSGETYYGITPSERQVFRPISSEADRKRDEAVKTIMLTGWCQTAAEEIYDLVAAGKVPGMKLED